ncbi:hypothetical protein BpHYR1_013400 [Brachionus plicatilis]|uniref:Uncharacterized protein n=1 Tax=Brachionus plicatilis TaxID=10195 RepID=A0A3M7RGL3_BRAPC|nr:hypothetical protein BpHYR1_013400 [Brachionus plicatilis]
MSTQIKRKPLSLHEKLQISNDFNSDLCLSLEFKLGVLNNAYKFDIKHLKHQRCKKTFFRFFFKNYFYFTFNLNYVSNKFLDKKKFRDLTLTD